MMHFCSVESSNCEAFRDESRSGREQCKRVHLAKIFLRSVAVKNWHLVYVRTRNRTERMGAGLNSDQRFLSIHIILEGASRLARRRHHVPYIHKCMPLERRLFWSGNAALRHFHTVRFYSCSIKMRQSV